MNYDLSVFLNTVLVFLLLFVSPCVSTGQPWQVHGDLFVSVVGHAIEQSDGTPFLWLGDTGWAIIHMQP